jgi:sugar lactone lactonase YvrE
MGTAFLRDASFRDGVVEVDVAVTGARSYPGILFRVASPREFERVYLRPHRAGPAGYPDAVQYVPGFNGIDGWQLYNGDGFTAAATLPPGEWIRLRLEVKGTQARLFVGDAPRPALEIHDLKRGAGAGTLGLSGPRDGSARFSAFRFRADDGLSFEPPPRVDPAPGLVARWRLSSPFPARLVDPDRDPATQDLPPLTFTEVAADASGLVDVARHHGRLGPEPDAVLAKTVIRSEKDELKRFRFGYSDEVTLFLGGKPLFRGDSTYRLRDASFIGIVGLHDSVFLPLRKGENEVTLLLVENMGGWGFLLQDASAVFLAPGVSEGWRTQPLFAVPETVVRDPASGALFVSGWDGYHPSLGEGKQAISKLASDGSVTSARWAEGLRNPVGLAVKGDRLYAVESGGLAVLDLPTGRLVRRIAISGVGLNDLAVADDGTVYVSDSRADTILRVRDGAAEVWLKGPEVGRPNGLHLHGGRLFVGNNADACVKSVDVATREVRTIARLGAGTIDGIETDAAGNILVSQNEGRLLRISPAGEVTRLLDTTVPGLPCANFAWVEESRLAVCPAFTENRVVAWRIPPP